MLSLITLTKNTFLTQLPYRAIRPSSCAGCALVVPVAFTLVAFTPVTFVPAALVPATLVPAR